MSASVKNQISFNLGVRICQNHGKYLVAPSLIGRTKTEIFDFLKQKVNKRISGWRNKWLSRAGKEILLKSVIQAIPSYIMNVFLIPVSLCEELERMMNSFWWGLKKDGTKSLCWKNWDKLCVSKELGGLGFPKLRLYNLEMFGKQAWRLLITPDSLVSRVFEAKYYYWEEVHICRIRPNPSFVWRSIFETKAFLVPGLRYREGMGLTISVWKDAWL